MNKIVEMYRDWRKENGNRKPNRAIVKMRWEDGNNTEKGYQVDTIGIVPKRKLDEWLEPADDFQILYYVSSIQDLLDLMKPYDREHKNRHAGNQQVVLLRHELQCGGNGGGEL